MSRLVVRSTYLRRRLAADPPNEGNLDSYSDLLHLEGLLVERPRKWAAGLAYEALRRRYPEAFAAMATEIAPDLYQEHLDRAARREEEAARFAREGAAARRRLLRGLRIAARRIGSRRPESG